MTVKRNSALIYLSILFICIGIASSICPQDMLDCCGICYDPKSEDCIKLAEAECKIIERSLSMAAVNDSISFAAGEENIYDLLEEGKIDVETEGSDISHLNLKIEPTVEINLKVSIPSGTLFSANEGSSQSMVSTRKMTVEFEMKPGLDVSLEQEGQAAEPQQQADRSKQVVVPVACANLHKSIPTSSDTFTIKRSPDQEELSVLLPVLEAEGASYPVMQAAIWIITDNADYDDLGTLVSNGERIIRGYEASEAIRLIEKAGIDIRDRAIWEDRDQIERDNTGKPTEYVSATTIVTECAPCPEGWSGPAENCTCWKCEECPEGWEGPNEKCECWRWETAQ